MIQKQVVRYLIGGSMSFSIEFFCFNLLFYAGMASVIISNSVSFCVGLTASLLINKLWVFRSDTSNDWSLWRVVGFVVLGVGNILITNCTINLLVLVGVPGFIAKCGLMVCVAFWNFLIMKKIIFR